jgi:hypothetical protein
MKTKQTRPMMRSSEYKINRCTKLKLLGFAFLLLLSQVVTRISAFSTIVIASRTKQQQQIATASTTSLLLSIVPSSTTINECNPIESFEEEDDNDLLSPSSSSSSSSSSSRRRSILMQILTTAATTTMALSLPSACHAASSSARKIDPETAYRNLRKAREELAIAGRTYFPKQDWDGLREYLDDDNEKSYNINHYDDNASALLTSTRLDAESKKAIGTIRRFGVGADVIIMYGGLKAELSEDNERPNSADIQKYYLKTLDSIEEVIAIIKSNPGFSKID